MSLQGDGSFRAVADRVSGKMGARLPPAGMATNRHYFSFCVLATEPSLEDRGGPEPVQDLFGMRAQRAAVGNGRGAGQGGRPTRCAAKETHSFYAHD